MTRQRRLAPSSLRALVATHGTPLLVIDCSVIRAQYRKLKRALPGSSSTTR
jgi:diaminopimelate decarboxylase